MAPIEITEDYYAVLKISRTATLAEIRKSYLLLARTEHPDKNSGNPKASDAFVLIQTAYETLKDTAKKREYDVIWPSITESMQAKGAAAERKRGEEHRAAERERNRAEAQKENLRRQAEEWKHKEEAEMKRKAEERKRKEEAEMKRKAEKQNAEQQQRKAETCHQPKPATRTYVYLSKLSVEQLREKKEYNDREIFKLARQIWQLGGEIERLDAQDSSKSNNTNRESGTTWDANSTSYFYSSTSSNDTSEAKMEKERERLRRGVAKRIKENELQNTKTKFEELKSEMQAVEERIGPVRKPPGQPTRFTASQQNQEEVRKKAQEQQRQEEQKRKLQEQQRQEEQKRKLQEQQRQEEQRQEEQRQEEQRQEEQRQEEQRQEEQRKKVQEQQRQEEWRIMQEQQREMEEQQNQEWFNNLKANIEHLGEQVEEMQRQRQEWTERELEEQLRRLSVHQAQASTIPNLGGRTQSSQPQQNFNPYNPQPPQPQNYLNPFDHQTPDGVSAFRNLNGHTSYPQRQPPAFPQPQPQPQVFAQPYPARTIPLCPGTIDENSTAFNAIGTDGSILRFPCWVYYVENDRVQCWRCGLVVYAADILQRPHPMPWRQQYKLPITIMRTAIPYPDPLLSTEFGTIESLPANAMATAHFWPGWQPQL